MNSQLNHLIQLKPIDNALVHLCVFLLPANIIINGFFDYDPLLLMGIILGCYVYWKYRIPFIPTKNVSVLLWTIGIYYGYYVFHVLVSAYFYGLDERSLNLISKIITLIPFVYFAQLIKFDFKKYIILICTLLASSIFIFFGEAFFVVGLDSLLDHAKLGYVLSEQNGFAWFISWILFFCFTLLIFRYNHLSNKQKTFLIMIIGMVVVFIVLSGARSNWLGISFSFLVMAFLIIKKQVLNLKTFMMIGSVFFIMVLIVILSTDSKIFYTINRSLSEIKSAYEGDFITSLGLRIVQYKIAIDAIVNNFFWGIADVNYYEYLQNIIANRRDLVADKNVAQSALVFNHVHNHFLMHTMTRGIGGLITSVLVLLIPLVHFFKTFLQSNNAFKLCISSVGILFLTTSLISFQLGGMLYYSHGILYYFYFIALNLIVLDSLSNQDD